MDRAPPGGAPIDRGGGWRAPTHDAAFRPAGEVGVGTYKTWVRGANLLVHGARVGRYTGLIPTTSHGAIDGAVRSGERAARPRSWPTSSR